MLINNTIHSAPLPARIVNGMLQFSVPRGSNVSRMIQILVVAAGSTAR